MNKSLSPRYTHGPIIKSGPTKGQNRSRNKDGQWRKKRSDTGTKRNPSCEVQDFIDSINQLYF